MEEWPRFHSPDSKGRRYRCSPAAHAGALRQTLNFMRKEIWRAHVWARRTDRTQLKSSTYRCRPPDETAPKAIPRARRTSVRFKTNREDDHRARGTNAQGCGENGFRKGGRTSQHGRRLAATRPTHRFTRGGCPHQSMADVQALADALHLQMRLQ